MRQEDEYLNYFEKKNKEWENLCKQCGGCCGAYDDPCQHLKKGPVGKYYCDIYEQRFGLRRTLKGEEFNCVLIKEILHTRWEKDYLCYYKKHLKNI